MERLRFFRDCAAYLLLMAALQSVIGIWLDPPSSRRKEIADRYVQSRPDILVFGDSVNRSTAPDDPSQDSITQLLQARVGDQTVGSIDRPAYHLAMYRAYLSYLDRRGYVPRTIILPITLQTFSPRVYRRPRFQFARTRYLLEGDGPLFAASFKPLLVFGWYDLVPVSRKAFLATPVYDGTTRIGAVADFEAIGKQPPNPERMKKIMTYLYMGRIAPDHPLLMELRAILDRYRDGPVRVILYAAPVDVETGEKYVGPRFRAQLAENVGIVRAVVEDYGFELHDLSQMLPHESFYYRKYPNEHLRYEGRRAVAEWLATWIPAPSHAP